MEAAMAILEPITPSPIISMIDPDIAGAILHMASPLSHTGGLAPAVCCDHRPRRRDLSTHRQPEHYLLWHR